MTVEELKQIYPQKRREIRSRLAEFEEVGRTASDEKLFEELVFCIYTAGASARMGLRSVEAVRPVLINGTLRDIQRALDHKHRWPEARGAYTYETREYLRERAGLRMRELLSSFETADERRDFFAANPGVRGLGYKEGSHFLRNVGFRGYAILDKHILARLAEFGVIESPKPPSTKKRYLDLEQKLKLFSERIDIDFDELDLLLWYTKTGEILK
ncbi:MAG TPA: N-glycosylase/DNA lyase [Blastocatellia bacterium]|nr:N-glycosylase/DNA lyase [Blastocatellia bacterium]